ncbi:hypothetical protein HG535_0A03810 [Zygotorulaspora mrakii]|uniref:Ribonucleoside-diphosphate reductase n=1 Tax=Zygotorulaspora mrakii TaxID=42260 RepID=A0A7H9AXZ1_ZYGMR|nr:uncharacterized protein HG535_0A03810 [Zygotorulaspora mrakii]QLG70442.1 hypothetical protein HG535_0A03810 [Zygotorulaspora mrakii]
MSNAFDPDALSKMLKKLSYGLNKDHIDIDYAMERVTKGISSAASKQEIIAFVAETLATLASIHPDHSILAARLEIHELHRSLNNVTFTENLSALLSVSRTDAEAASIDDDPLRKRQKLSRVPKKGVISPQFFALAKKYQERLNNAIVSERDYEFTYFGWKTLCQSYLIKKANKVHETPQFMFMRVALAIHGPYDDIDLVLSTYELMSQRYFIHASPTLFNAGTVNQYLSSCFLVGMQEDSIDGIYKTLHKTALISKASGGIGIHVSNIRASGSFVSGSNGISNGLVPMLRVFNNTARYVDQGGNKRPGAYCIYLEPWHSDIFDFLQLRKNHGKEEMRARDLFLALWIPDLFMERVESNGDWSLFSPDEAPGLNDVYGEEFNKLYGYYEETRAPMRVVKAQKLWAEILQSQTETGGPFMLYKDACNKKSNQKNLGTIKSSNLCCEIVEYSSKDEIAVCNLASVALPSFVRTSNSETKLFDFDKLHSVVKVVTKNLDRVIDIGDYPVEEARNSNLKHRPEAIGVQGLADLFFILKIPFESEEASTLNKQIFETIYHAAIEASIELAEEYGPYSSFESSPSSEGILQFDFWKKPNQKYDFLYKDWDDIKERIKNRGLRNSLLVGPMPTASTSQILGYNESFEPMTSNVYTRRVLSGEFIVINQHMVNHFCDLGIWDEKLKNKIIMHDGSVKDIEGLPEWIKDIYKTVWEIPQRRLIDLARERSPFIDQSQSLNLFMKTPTMGKLTGMHFYAWRQGLKTGMYYLRTQAAAAAIQFTINSENTLASGVSLPKSKRQEKKDIVSGIYPLSADKELFIHFFSEAGESLANLKKDDYNNKGNVDSCDDVFGIHDSTPLACNLGDNGEVCEGCSG